MGENGSKRGVLALVLRLERELLGPETRGDAARMHSLLAEEFCEVGSSGRVFGREEIVALLQKEPAGRFLMEDAVAAFVAESVILVTYRAVRVSEREQGAGESRAESLRSSLWVLREGRWRMLFHQGTLASSLT